MSLLLEALKKAEKAKEEAQRRAKGDPAPAAGAEIRLEPVEAAPAEKPVITRSELPDIRQPLEILTEEITPRQAESAPSAEPAAAPRAEADRAAARKVFEAKFREPNPRLPFYIAIGVLGVFAVGTVAYFWYQLRPPPPLVNAKPVRPPEQTAAAVPDPGPAAPGALSAAPAAIPGLPAAAPAPTPAAATPRPAVQVASIQPGPQPRLATPRPAVALSAAEPARPRTAPQVHPKVASGYAAYLGGDFPVARADYEAALRDESGNRDALLGLAALDVRSGRFESAEGIYLRLLQADPRDPHAQAALIALRSSRLDPLATESRVKNMLATDPEAEALHFTLGNQLAQQGRWAEAQAAYFKAFAADPENPDFAFNLAVSLDHLRQPKPALEYYRRALELAARRSAGFDVETARSRAAQLAN